MNKIHILTTSNEHYLVEASAPETVWHDIQQGAALALMQFGKPDSKPVRSVLNPAHVVMVNVMP